VITLSKQRDGLRICRNCYARARAVPCAKCGTTREPAARDGQGRPLCPYCLVSDPVNLEECIRCGRRRQVSTRTPEGPVCATCNPRDILTCSSCGRTAVPCTVSKVTGQPRCGACARSRARCSRCGLLAPARAGTRDAPLCGDCAVPDPGFFKTCPACGSPGRLIAGACRRCHLRQRLDELLADGTGTVRPGLQVLHQTLATTDRPAAVLTCLSSATSQTMLT
jgi:ribosomal protein L40E